MDAKQQLITYLRSSKEMRSAKEISEHLHIPRNVVSAMLGNFSGASRHKPLPGFAKVGKGKHMRYGIGHRGKQVVLPKLSYRFPLPEDLWRGWVNPETGVVPERLGIYSHVWLSEKEK
jgi:hypothetical protein